MLLIGRMLAQYIVSLASKSNPHFFLCSQNLCHFKIFTIPGQILEAYIVNVTQLNPLQNKSAQIHKNKSKRSVTQMTWATKGQDPSQCKGSWKGTGIYLAGRTHLYPLISEQLAMLIYIAMKCGLYRRPQDSRTILFGTFFFSALSVKAKKCCYNWCVCSPVRLRANRKWRQARRNISCSWNAQNVPFLCSLPTVFLKKQTGSLYLNNTQHPAQSL